MSTEPSEPAAVTNDSASDATPAVGEKVLVEDGESVVGDSPSDAERSAVQAKVDSEHRLFEPKPESGAMAGSTVTLALRSKLDGPIGRLSELRKSLLFAELANVCYFDEESVARTVEPLAVSASEFFDRDGAQAYRFETEHDVVVACRGTEPHDINDVKADVDAIMAVVETVGRVHRGFNTETDDLWPRIEKTLHVDVIGEKPVWFCGHSLGGAMATICAGRCFMSDEVKNPEGLFTYGSPRVGDKQYINYVKDIQHIRWVNNNDIVPRLPPRLAGFRHHGREMYLDRKGRLRKLKAGAKFADRMRGFGASLLRFKLDPLSDHIVDAYIAAIATTIEASEK